MAAVHIGRLIGPVGFSRTVAIKRLHRHLCQDEIFVKMLLDEARLAGRVQHPNVVAMLDVVQEHDEVLLVMEYVAGESLMRLLRLEKAKGRRVPPSIASAILIDSLRGLHAAHEAKSERGESLELIHRDFTPHNIMLRPDGSSVVVDFGVAKAVGRLHTTEEGTIKGKLPYMAPEQVRAGKLSRRVDVYAAGAVLWEVLVGERAVGGETEAQILERLLYDDVARPSDRATDITDALDGVVMRALSRDPEERYSTAAAMARALEEAEPPALPSRVADWLQSVAGEQLEMSARRLATLEAEAARPVRPGSLRSAPSDAIETRIERTPTEEPSVSGTREVSTLAGENSELRAHTTPSRVAASSSRRGLVVIALAAALVPALWFGSRWVVRPTPQVGAESPASLPTGSPAPSPVEPGPSTPIGRPDPSVPSEGISAPALSQSGASSSRPAPASPRTTIMGRKPRCASVTVDPSGKKLFHPECMDDR